MRNSHVLGSKQHKGIGEPWRLFSHVEKGLPASDALVKPFLCPRFFGRFCGASAPFGPAHADPNGNPLV